MPTAYAGSTSMSGHNHLARAASARSVADGPSSNPNRRVRSRFTPPEQKKFQTCVVSAPRNALNFFTSHNLTKTVVVKLRQRSWPERGANRPETGLSAGPHGSDMWLGRPAFCGVQACAERWEENVPTGRFGGGRGTVVKPSSVIGLRGSRAPSWHRLRGWSSGRGHSSVRGRRMRPPQVGVRRGPGASISESAWSPIERARPVTAEGSSMSPLPRVSAGRFRRSGTRDLAEAAERLICGLWSRGNFGRRSDAGRGASEGAGVKAGEAPGAAGIGLDARASRCGTVIIGSMPRQDQLRPRRWRVHPAPVASGSRCRPATSDA